MNRSLLILRIEKLLYLFCVGNEGDRGVDEDVEERSCVLNTIVSTIPYICLLYTLGTCFVRSSQAKEDLSVFSLFLYLC